MSCTNVKIIQVPIFKVRMFHSNIGGHLISWACVSCRCKLINIRRLVCDWSNYEEDIAMLRQIIQTQIDNADHMIRHGNQPCHSPGHLLHFPLDISMVC